MKDSFNKAEERRRTNFDIFMKFEQPPNAEFEITGEVTDDAMQGWVDIMSVALGWDNEIRFGAASGGAGAGKAQFRPVTILKAIDAATPTLFKALVSGAHYGQVTFVFRRAGDKGDPFYTLTLKTVFISSIAQAANDDTDVLTEQVTLQYGAIQIGYRQQRNDGGLDKPVVTTWNQTANSKAF